MPSDTPPPMTHDACFSCEGASLHVGAIKETGDPAIMLIQNKDGWDHTVVLGLEDHEALDIADALRHAAEVHAAKA